MAAQRERISVAISCRELGVSKRAYYKSEKASLKKKQEEGRIVKIRRNQPRIGTRKLHYLLNEEIETEDYLRC